MDFVQRFVLDLWKKYSFPLVVTLLSKVYILLFIPLLSKVLVQNSRPLYLSIFDSWNIWDAPHYLSIAQYGYQTIGDEANFIAFFPLFPLIVNLFHKVSSLSILSSGFVTSGIFSFLAAIMFYKLTIFEFDKTVAKRSVVFMFFFPTSLFLHIPYTESLFLFLAVFSIYCARTQKNWVSFLLAGLSTGTRMHGLALALSIFITTLGSFKMKLKKRVLLLSFSLIILFSGFIIYLALNQFLYGNIFHFTLVQKENWGNSFNFFGVGLLESFKSIFWRTGKEMYLLGIGQIIAFILALTATILALLKLDRVYGIYCLLLTLMIYSSSFWLSNLRYLLVVFPLFMFMGKFLPYKISYLVWLPISFALMTIFSLWAINFGPVF